MTIYHVYRYGIRELLKPHSKFLWQENIQDESPQRWTLGVSVYLMRKVLIKTLGKEISLHQVCREKRYDGYSGLKAQSEKSPGENVSTSRISLPLADKNNIKIVLNNNEIKLTKFSWRKFRSLRERLRSYLNRSNIWFELRSICFHHSLWVTDNWPIVMPHSFPFVDEWALLPFSHLPSRVSCLPLSPSRLPCKHVRNCFCAGQRIFSRFFFNVFVRREALKKDRNKGANLSLRCYKPGRNVLQTVQTKPFQL